MKVLWTFVISAKFGSGMLHSLDSCGYLKYELGVIPKVFLNMEVKALGVP